MKKKNKKILEYKLAAGTVKGANKVANRIKATQEIIGRIESAQKTISDTLYVKDNIIVDLRNFSLTSIPK